MNKKNEMFHNDCFEYKLNIQQFRQNGVALLFRNEIDSSTGNYRYSPYPGDNYLFDQTPVAKGITAYLADGSNSNDTIRVEKILRNGKDQTFTEYYLSSVQKEIESLECLPNSQRPIDVKLHCQRKFIDEIEPIRFSSKYYNESLNDNDHRLKLLIQEYANEYIEFLQIKIPEIKKGLGCLDKYSAEDIIFIFKKLKNLLDKSVTEQNFLSTFQADALPNGWEPIKWKGSNPELATLINQLTDKTLTPKTVKEYFRTDYEFDSQKTRVTNNRKIIEIIRKAMISLI